MTSILWATSFRPFGKSKNNDEIQTKFLDCVCECADVNITMCITQFGEELVEENLDKFRIKKKIFNSKPPKGFKYSQSIILANALDEYIHSGEYDHLVWSTCDFTFEKDLISELTDKIGKQEQCNIILPQHNVDHLGTVNPFAFNFGIDFFSLD